MEMLRIEQRSNINKKVQYAFIMIDTKRGGNSNNARQNLTSLVDC